MPTAININNATFCAAFPALTAGLLVFLQFLFLFLSLALYDSAFIKRKQNKFYINICHITKANFNDFCRCKIIVREFFRCPILAAIQIACILVLFSFLHFPWELELELGIGRRVKKGVTGLSSLSMSCWHLISRTVVHFMLWQHFWLLFWCTPPFSPFRLCDFVSPGDFEIMYPSHPLRSLCGYLGRLFRLGNCNTDTLVLENPSSFKDTALSARAIMCTLTRTRHLSAQQWQRNKTTRTRTRRQAGREHSYHLQSGKQNKGNYGIIRARCSNCIGRKHLSHIGSSPRAGVDKSTAAQHKGNANCTHMQMGWTWRIYILFKRITYLKRTNN